MGDMVQKSGSGQLGACRARTFLEILTDELALRCLQQDGQAFYLTNKKGPVS